MRLIILVEVDKEELELEEIVLNDGATRDVPIERGSGRLNYLYFVIFLNTLIPPSWRAWIYHIQVIS